MRRKPIQPSHLLLGVIAALALVASACAREAEEAPTAEETPTFAAGSFMTALQAKGEIVIGVKFDIPQIGFLNPASNQPEGFEIELGKLLAGGLGVKPRFEEAVSANRIPFLKEDKVDLIISTMTITDQRREEIDFSVVYYVAGQTLLVRKGSKIIDVKTLDAQSAPVCSAQGSTSEKNIQAAAPNAEVVLQKGYAECFQLLQNDQVKAVTTDDVILLQFIKQDPQRFALTGGRFSLEPYGMGVKKGRPEFVEFLNDTINDIKAGGKWVRLYDEWIKPMTGRSANPPPDDVKATTPARPA
ncbi:MAG: transporter substrate-binding domain-containing protein [Candidatus Methylomirabilales bacterium]